jgi:hypothetical protein
MAGADPRRLFWWRCLWAPLAALAPLAAVGVAAHLEQVAPGYQTAIDGWCTVLVAAGVLGAPWRAARLLALRPWDLARWMPTVASASLLITMLLWCFDLYVVWMLVILSGGIAHAD